MRLLTVLPFLIGSGLGLSSALTGAVVAGACDVATFSAILPSNATITSVAHVANGSAYGEGPAADPGFPGVPTRLPELCAVIVNVTTSPISNYRFGMFLPAGWNGRFLAVGNGGFAGGINWQAMGDGVRYGHAVVSTDTGHSSGTGDVRWALHNPERQADWGYRAIHGAVTLGRNLTEAYYGSAIAYSYYAGGSTGGRQGLREAQLDPASFDGMLIGAPAWWTSHLQPWTTKVAMYNLPASDPKHIPARLFSLLGQEAIRQCDAADGLPDGIISYPDRCDFDPSRLLCTLPSNANSTAGCLTPAQVATAHSFYADYVAESRFAFPGMEVGSESQFAVLLGADAPSTLGSDYVKYFLYDDPAWNWTQYRDGDIWKADAADPGSATADHYTSLAAFRDRGGKIFMYHGLADSLIPPKSSYVFYNKVAAALGSGSNDTATDSDILALLPWFRFFPVAGMQHVTGTAVDAPWYFAGAGAAGALGSAVYSTPGFVDAQHDAFLALMDWVEHGKVIDEIVATTWKRSQDPNSGVLRQRPLCPFPKIQVYDGVGDEKLVGSFSCK